MSPLSISFSNAARCRVQHLDRLVGHLRHRVHQTLYAQITGSLSPTQQARLDALLQVTDGPSGPG